MSSSSWAHRLGHAGLIPFVAGAALVWLVHPEAHPYAVLALATYASVIVSFLGGIHWGVAFRQEQPDPRLLVWGVVPSLVAWVAVVMPPEAGLVVSGVMLAVCYAVDRRLYLAHGLARWLTLRFRLSAVASVSSFLGAAGA
jgi:hypothetical protein